MKKPVLFFILFVALLSIGAASAPVVSEALVRIQSEVTSGAVTAYFEKSVVLDGVTYRQPWEAVSWNADATEVTVNGKTMSYGEVMQFVVAIANQERATQQAAAQAAP